MRVAALVDGVGPPAVIPSLVHTAVEAGRERNSGLDLGAKGRGLLAIPRIHFNRGDGRVNLTGQD
jgi:hypothetical protein